MQARAIGKRRVSECVVRMPSPDDAFAAPLMLRVAQCLGLQAEAERHERAVQARLDQQEQALAELREQLERTTTQQAALILQLREDVQRLAEAQHQHAVATAAAGYSRPQPALVRPALVSSSASKDRAEDVAREQPGILGSEPSSGIDGSAGAYTPSPTHNNRRYDAATCAAVTAMEAYYGVGVGAEQQQQQQQQRAQPSVASPMLPYSSHQPAPPPPHALPSYSLLPAAQPPVQLSVGASQPAAAQLSHVAVHRAANNGHRLPSLDPLLTQLSPPGSPCTGAAPKATAAAASPGASPAPGAARCERRIHFDAWSVEGGAAGEGTGDADGAHVYGVGMYGRPWAAVGGQAQPREAVTTPMGGMYQQVSALAKALDETRQPPQGEAWPVQRDSDPSSKPANRIDDPGAGKGGAAGKGRRPPIAPNHGTPATTVQGNASREDAGGRGATASATPATPVSRAERIAQLEVELSQSRQPEAGRHARI